MEKAPSLYSMTAVMQDALSNIRLDEETGEVTGWEEVEALSLPLTEKTLNVCRFIASNDHFIEGLEKVRAETDKRIRRHKKLSEYLKKNVLVAMAQLDSRRLEDFDIVAYARRSEAVDIVDQSLIPESFITVTSETSVRKQDIKKALKSGKDVPGARLVENLSLTIK